MPGNLNGPLTGFTDRCKGKGQVSSAWIQQIGKSAAQASGGGIVAATNSGAGISPGTINNDNVLAVWSIPAGLFDIAGRALEIQANGSVANNSNSKRIKIIVNPTTAVVGSAVVGGVTVADSGAYTTTGAAGWQIGAIVSKYGAAGSNTQLAVHSPTIIGSTSSTLLAPSLLTLNETAPILIALTGNAVTAIGDIVMNFAQIFATN